MSVTDPVLGQRPEEEDDQAVQPYTPQNTTGVQNTPQALAQAWASNDYLDDEMIPRKAVLVSTPEQRAVRTRAKYSNRSGSTSRRRELASLRFQLEHAATKGVISREQAQDYMEAEDHNWMDRLLHLEERGSLLQSAVDVLSVGNYLSASMAKSTLAWRIANDEKALQEYVKTGELSGYSFGISTQEFRKNWNRRTTYKDVLGYDFGDKGAVDSMKDARFWKALSADIFLDPVTYLTFGVGPLTRVAATKVAKGALIKRMGAEGAEAFLKKATRTATVHGAELTEFTLGRWGATCYEVASQDLIGELAETATKANAAARATGARELVHGSSKMITDFNERVLAHMITNYDDVARRAVSSKLYTHNPMRTTVGRATRVASKAMETPGKAAIAGAAVGGGAGAMASNEDGLTGRLAGGLAGAALGAAAGAGLQKLHGPMGAYPPLEDMFRETSRFGRGELGLMKSGQIGESLAKVTKHVPRIDNFFRGFNRTWGMDTTSRMFYNAYRSNVAKRSSDWMQRTAKVFGNFTEEERMAASRLLEDAGSDLSARNAATSIAREAGLKSTDRVIECARHAQRMFTEIAEEEQKYGLLGQSINNYVTHFYKNTKLKHQLHSVMRNSGLGSSANPFSMHRDIATLADAAEIFGSDEVITDLAKIVWMRKKTSIEYVARQKFYTQIKLEHGLPAAIKESSRVGMARHLKHWLINNSNNPEVATSIDQVWQTEGVNIGRFGFAQGNHRRNRQVIEFLTGRARNYRQKFVTDDLRLAAQLPQTIKVRWRHLSKEVDIGEMLDNLYDGAPMTQQLSKQEYVAAIRKLDGELRKRGIPLLSAFPDITERLAAKTNTKAVKGVKFKSLTEALNAPIEGLRMAAQLPEEVVVRARVMRQKVGDFTDVLRPNPKIKRQIDGLAQQIGFKAEELDELLENLFGRKGMDNLSARQTEMLRDYLTGWTRPKEVAARTIAGKPGKASTVWDPFLRGEALVRYSFSPWKKQRATNVLDIMDDVEEKLGALGETTIKHDEDIAAAWRTIDEAKEAVKGIRKAGSTGSVRQWIRDEVPSVVSSHKARQGAVEGFDKAKADVDQGKEVITQLKGFWKNKIQEAIDAGAGPHSNQVKELKRQRGEMVSGAYDRLKELKRNQTSAWDKLTSARARYRKSYATALADHEEPLKEMFGRQVVEAEGVINAAKGRIDDAVRGRQLTRKQTQVQNLRRRLANARTRALKDGTPKNKKAVEKLQRKLHEVLDSDEAARQVIEGDDVIVKPLTGPTADFTRGAASSDQLFRNQDLGGNFVKGQEPLDLGGDVYYFPESITRLLDEISHSTAETNAWLRGYDFVQNLFKAPLMAPHVAFFKRNAVTNVALNTLRCGLSLLHPSTARDYMRATCFYIANNGSDLAKGGRIVKSAVKSGAVMGAVGGAIGGTGYAATHEDVGYMEGIAKGVGIGVGFGAGVTGMTGLGMLGGLKAAPLALKADEFAAKGVRAAGEAIERSGLNVKGIGGKIKRLGDTHINVGGERFTMREFIDEAEKHGVFWTHVSKELFPSGMASTKAQVIGMSDMFRAGELLSETPTRLMLFTAVAKETGSFAKAGQAVKDYLFDYSNLSIVERKVMRRFMPFYSWVRHAMTVSYNSVIDYPGRFTAQWKFVENSNPDIDPTMMPDWLQNKMKRIRRDSDGTLVVRANFGLAHEDAIDVVQGVTSGVKYIHGSLTGDMDPEDYDHALRLLSRGPFGVTSAVEFAFNKESFSGKIINHGERYESDFSPAQYRNAAGWLQGAVGYKKDAQGRETINPTWAWLMGEIPHSRFVNLARQIYETDEFDHTTVNYGALARRVLSESVYKYDPEQQQYYQDRARIEQMTIALKNLGLARSYSMTVGDAKRGGGGRKSSSARRK